MKCTSCFIPCVSLNIHRLRFVISNVQWKLSTLSINSKALNLFTQLRTFVSIPSQRKGQIVDFKLIYKVHNRHRYMGMCYSRVYMYASCRHHTDIGRFQCVFYCYCIYKLSLHLPTVSSQHFHISVLCTI